MWVLFLLLSIVFFVAGQACLRFDKNTDVFLSASCFFMVSGLFGFLLFVYYNFAHRYRIRANNTNVINFSTLGLIAGVFFFFGNLLWIYCIQKAPSLSLVRILMAGFETVLLVTIGYLLFQEKISVLNVVGFGTILVGVYLSLKR